MTAADPKFFLIAGEPSGDRLGAALLSGLRDELGAPPQVDGVGGPEMAAEGLESRFPMEDLSVMGVAEVLPRLPLLLRRIRETAEAVVAARPDALVTIDSPDFTLRVARRARQQLPDLKVIHYVAPSVWAWRPGRAAKMAKVVDHVLALLPFEPPYMEAAGLTCDFVGHPVVTEPQPSAADIDRFRAEFAPGDGPLLLLLPGSRGGEVFRLGPDFLQAAGQVQADRPDVQLLMQTVGPQAETLRDMIAGSGLSVRLLEPGDLPAEAALARKRACFAAADLALAASGTVSLELAAASTPMVIAYRGAKFSQFLARRLVKLDTVTLVNILTDSRIVPEYLLEDCTPAALAGGVAALLDDPDAMAAQKAAFATSMTLLGQGDLPPGRRAARSVLDQIRP
ncbi:lipid-A-disaccharide synthase [Oceanomicrobium pacificus]|uniref:Lipid-A-disaccharide synthase n=1 Tax=Oceanomicrobium pacificus TaxID=2692916 RepID=A0A6B0TVM5_9RHOB|nr:lipid-A-disaccharide synthase [Oceanomicrobium pacificus]MXU65825.1 lipid-A-disaccharide synthase [Oceanomicrobium pacificus]